MTFGAYWRMYCRAVLRSSGCRMQQEGSSAGRAGRQDATAAGDSVTAQAAAVVLPRPLREAGRLRLRLGLCAEVRAGAAGSPTQQAGANFFGPTYAKTYREETQVQLRKEAIDGGYAQRVASDASDKSISKSEVKP